MKPILTLSCLLIGYQIMAQTQVDLTTCDASSSGVVCIQPTDSLYQLCVKLKTGPCASKGYKIDWGDGSMENITLTNELTLNHRYDLRNFVKNCSAGEVRYTIFVENATCANDNKGFRVAFNKKPAAGIAVQNACEGAATRFQNSSCPTSSDVQFRWEFSDGRTSTAVSPSLTFGDPNVVYKAKLTATSANCGVSTTETEFKLKKLPVADYSTTGFTVVNRDTVVCLSSGGTLTMDGTISLDETSYDWQITGGTFSFLNNTNRGSGRVVIKFNESKEYTVTLTVRNDCGVSKPMVCKHKVVAEPKVQLPKKGSVCQPSFLYQFSPQADVTYTLDGRPFNPAVGENLTARSTPYIIEAKAPSPCQPSGITDRDTVLVTLPRKALISSRSRKDTVLCVGTPPLVLNAIVAGGKWRGSLLETRAGQTVFNPSTKGKYVLTYGDEPCLQLDSLTITVDGIEATAQNIAVCEGQTIVRLQASPAGGRWTSPDCANCIRGDTLLLSGLSVSQLSFTYQIANTNGCPASARATVSIGRPRADFDLQGGCVGRSFSPSNRSASSSSFEWFVNGTLVSTTSQPSLSLPAGVVGVRLVAKSGTCTNAVEKSVTITTPPRNANFTPNKTEDCSPAVIALAPEGTARSDVSYTWDFGGQGSSNAFLPANQTFTNQGRSVVDLTITFTASNACGTVSSSKTIKIKPRPVAEIGVSETLVRCTPSSVKLSNRSTGHTKANSIWDFGDGTPPLTSAADTLSHRYSARDSSRTYVIRLRVSSECGVDNAQVSIRVIPTEVRPLIGLDKTEVCVGEAIQFRDASTPKPTQWQWRFGDGSISTAERPAHRYQRTGSFTVWLKATTECGYDSTSALLRIVAPPVPAFEVASGVVCANQAVQFLNSSNNNLRFLWEFGDRSVDSTTYSPRHIYQSGGQFVARLTVYGSSKACFNTIEKSVAVRQAVKAAFDVASAGAVCAPGSVTLTDRSQNANQWEWTLSNGAKSTIQNPTFALGAGNYEVRLKATYNGVCKDSTFSTTFFSVDSCTLQIPEAFSPNGDGAGDRYTVFGKNIKMVKYLKIRNRWGEVIFERNDVPANTQNIDETWDGTVKGTEQPPGLFAVEVEVEFIDGSRRREARTFYLIR